MKKEYTPLEMVVFGVSVVVSTVLLLGLMSAVMALVLQWAWNTLLAAVFGLPELSYSQAFALTLIVGSLKGLLSFSVTPKTRGE